MYGLKPVAVENGQVKKHFNQPLEFMNRLCALSRINLQTLREEFGIASWIDCACSGGLLWSCLGRYLVRTPSPEVDRIPRRVKLFIEG
jgi:hypothetical protein